LQPCAQSAGSPARPSPEPRLRRTRRWTRLDWVINGHPSFVGAHQQADPAQPESRIRLSVLYSVVVTVPPSTQEPSTQDPPPSPPGTAKVALNLLKKTYAAILELGKFAAAIFALVPVAGLLAGVLWFTHDSNTNPTIDSPGGSVPHCAEFHGS